MDLEGTWRCAKRVHLVLPAVPSLSATLPAITAALVPITPTLVTSSSSGISTSAISAPTRITASTPTISTAARVTSSPASAAAPGIGEIDLDASAIKILFVETVYGGVSLLRRSKSNESKAARTPGVAVPHNDGIKHLSEVGKRIAQRIIRRIPTQIANIDLCRHNTILGSLYETRNQNETETGTSNDVVGREGKENHGTYDLFIYRQF